MKNKNRYWYDYLWIITPIYLILGFFNILFAWLGLIFFLTPIIIAVFKKDKSYCNRYCDKGKFLQLLGKNFKLSRNRATPSWIVSKYFRYGFLVFFLLMFGQMLWITYLVFKEITGCKEIVKLLWTLKIPWIWSYHNKEIAPWIIQFAFGFYSMMLTSTFIGIIFMIFFKPRSWCTFCPMGTMTQLICKIHIKLEGKNK